ncbi:hypothetical protein TNCV_3653261 [Trichonephila clavipes]|nr:hypothetical protein TNCV_3653261 [Trichonephila clavipes]
MMAQKQSKNIGKFDLIIKELKAFESRINECDYNKSRIRVLKTKVLQYETRLTGKFSELSTHESDESFDIYMKYKNILFNWVVDLEQKAQVRGISKVTSAMPNFPIKYHEWPHINDLTLDDPTFYIENEIDILLGADVFMTFFSGTPIMGPKCTPSALPTK